MAIPEACTLRSVTVHWISAVVAVLGICGGLLVTRYVRPSGLSGKEYTLFGRPLVLTVAITLAFGWAIPGIDNWAHLFGLLAGAAVGWFLLKDYQDADGTGAGLLRTPLVIALTTVCLAASATINRYPVLRRVSALIQEGEKSLAHGDRVQALSDFREAEQLEPADYRPHLQMSSIYSALGQDCQAGEEHQWALSLNPRSLSEIRILQRGINNLQTYQDL